MQKTKVILDDGIFKTTSLLASILDSVDNSLTEVSESSNNLRDMRRLFKDIQLSSSYAEILEDKENKEKKDGPKRMQEYFDELSKMFEPLKAVEIINPLNLLNNLYSSLYPEYTFLEESLSKLETVGEAKCIQNSIENYDYKGLFNSLEEKVILLETIKSMNQVVNRQDSQFDYLSQTEHSNLFFERGQQFLRPDIDTRMHLEREIKEQKEKIFKTLFERLNEGDINALKYLFEFLPRLEDISELDVDKMQEEIATSTSGLMVEYITKVTTAANISASILEEIPGLKNRVNKVWKETERIYKSLTEEFLYRSENQVVDNPLLTNVAKILYRDLPGVDEIENGATPSQVSPYNKKRATKLLQAIASAEVYSFLKDPEKIIPFVAENLGNLVKIYEDIYENMFNLYIDTERIFSGFGNQKKSSGDFLVRCSFEDNLLEIKETLGYFSLLNFDEIKAKKKRKKKAKSKVHTRMKKYQKIINILDEVHENPNVAEAKVYDFLKMHRRSRLKRTRSPLEEELENPTSFDLEQNSWGTISLSPSRRPKVRFKDIFGDSYTEVKSHLETIALHNEIPSLYAATSPSKSIKANILLIGPQGCGKTELFRAMSSEKKKLVINVSGGDMRSKWYGTSEQNVLLLAKAAQKLGEDRGMIVYVLIDEIDTLLGLPTEGGSCSDVDMRILKTFQEIMDGVRQYEGIVWCGATNSPEKLPPAILRRFAYVDAVGELTLEERAGMLKHYITLGLPTSRDIRKEDYTKYAQLFDGAVGDIIRKVADYMHEYLISDFMKNNRKAAKSLDAKISKGGFDVHSLTKKDRAEIKRELRKQGVMVDKELLRKAAYHVAETPSIQNEIKEAERVYDNARHIRENIQKHLKIYQ